jgi:hypothetical protein
MGTLGSIAISCPWPMLNGVCCQPVSDDWAVHAPSGQRIRHCQCAYGHRFHTSLSYDGCEPCDCDLGG